LGGYVLKTCPLAPFPNRSPSCCQREAKEGKEGRKEGVVSSVVPLFSLRTHVVRQSILLEQLLGFLLGRRHPENGKGGQEAVVLAVGGREEAEEEERGGVVEAAVAKGDRTARRSPEKDVQVVKCA
jgi:hypothetical protein